MSSCTSESDKTRTFSYGEYLANYVSETQDTQEALSSDFAETLATQTLENFSKAISDNSLASEKES